MHVDGFVQAVVEDLGRTAAVGDEATTRAALLLTSALDSSLRRRLQEALAEAALELSAQMAPARVDVRVAGADLELVPVDLAEEPARSSGTMPGEDGALSARITLRLPESLKSRLETAALAAGVSLNSFLIQSLGRAAEPRSSTHGGGRRLTGYGRS